MKISKDIGTINAIILWILNIAHVFWTYWAVGYGTQMEMAVLFPICFLHIPALVPIIVAIVVAIMNRERRSVLIFNLVPVILLVLQVGLFWLGISAF